LGRGRKSGIDIGHESECESERGALRIKLERLARDKVIF